MIDLTNIKYDKENGIITAIAEYMECKYDIRINTETWDVTSSNINTPKIVLSKCKFKFRKLLAERETLPSEHVIAWY